MKKIILTAVMLFAGIVIFSAGANAQGIKEGKWSMTMVTKMEGAQSEEMAQAMKEMENMSAEDKAMMQQMMGGMNIQMGAGGAGMTTTITQCLTNENPVPENNTKENCRETHSMEGSTVKFEEVCDDSKSTGEVTYDNDSMQGMIKSEQTENGQVTNAAIELTGQYVGPCDK